MVLLLHDAKIPVREDITINSMFLFSFFPENPCSVVVVGMQEEEKCLGRRRRRRLIVAYQDGKRLATMKIQ
jgi:3-hydroxymyristoyl/3-hydroxydecanoyl-(acyl carrier protein) dehydratase